MKYIRLAVLTFVGTSLLSSAACATFEPTAAYNWTGFYAGGNVGLVSHTMDVTDTDATTFLSTLHQVSNPSWSAGLQGGYRRQLNMCPVTGVYGLEASFNFSNARFDKTYGSSFATYQLNSQHQLKDTALMEVMGGIAADRVLLFLTAGLSWVNIGGTTTNDDSIAFFDSFNVSKNVLGTALGCGIEYAYNDKMSVRFKVDAIMPTTYSTHDNVGNSFQVSNNIGQAVLGINYKFA